MTKTLSQQKRAELNAKYCPYKKAGGWSSRVVRAIVKEAGLEPDLVVVTDTDLLIIGCDDGLVDHGADAADIFEFCQHLKELPHYANVIRESKS